MKPNSLKFEMEIYKARGLPYVTAPEKHTMGESLVQYLALKVHHLAESQKIDHVQIIGDYDRETATISKNEKSGKMFNKRRPTAILHNKTLIVKCFPGIDYVQHYAAIYATYFNIHRRRVQVSYELPSETACFDGLLRTNIADVSGFKTIILGSVESFSNVTRASNKFIYKRKGDFEICYTRRNDTILLGCKFSFWGDIAGRLTRILAAQGAETILYVGKLGALKKGVSPNSTIATGCQSVLNGKNIVWSNLFEESALSNVDRQNGMCLEHGIHVTSPSILMETTAWLHENQQYDFVDPEIGHMAAAALSENIRFSYLHLVSNNLAEDFGENLSNERERYVLEKRSILSTSMENILLKSLNNERN